MNLSVQWGHKDAKADKTITFQIAMSVYAITLSSFNNGLTVGAIQKESLTNTGFKIWYWNDNTVNLETYWTAIGI